MWSTYPIPLLQRLDAQRGRFLVGILDPSELEYPRPTLAHSAPPNSCRTEVDTAARTRNFPLWNHVARGRRRNA